MSNSNSMRWAGFVLVMSSFLLAPEPQALAQATQVQIQVQIQPAQPGPLPAGSSDGVYPNLIDLQQRWTGEEWQYQCEAFKSKLENALSDSRHALNSSKTLTPDGHRAASEILYKTLAEIANEQLHAERRIQPVAKRIAGLALSTVQLFQQHLSDDAGLYYERSYLMLERIAKFMIDEEQQVFDVRIYGTLGYGRTFNIREIEANYLKLISTLVQKVILEDTQLAYTDANGQNRVAPQGSYAVYYSLVNSITSFGYEELTSNMYGYANTCAINELRKAQTLAARWLENNNAKPGKKIEYNEAGIFEQTVAAVKRIKDFTTTPNCQYYRSNRFVYPAKLIPGSSTPSYNGRYRLSGEQR